MKSVVLLIGRVRAFVVRDFQLAVSYRLEFFMRMLSILFVTTTLFFISQIFAGTFSTPYEQWRDPFLAWITALPFLNYFMVGFSSLANAIRSEQAQGTLEGVLMTPIGIPTLIISSSAWDFVQASFHSFLYLFFGWAFFGVEYRGSFLLAVLFLLLTTLVLASIGILSASFAMVFKRGDPLGMLVGTGSALFSGVFFPTQLTSQYAGGAFRIVSNLIPTTYGIDGIRRVLIQGQTFAEARRPFITLLIYLAVLLPFSLWVFARSVRRAKREGSLIQY
ncbi:MAG: type transport system permease protein [Acidobacteriota bacterium]|jgi:ABC-2 type transport system permease protein|nr:type transport system permease protein [Acidobacteriota bacterium]MDT7810023.1 type transport system permease protein [Acidobacteriota bacterium]